MRRRVEESGGSPPLEVTDYRAWCADRGVRPFGNPDDLESMRTAVAQWDVWEQLRREWADRHGIDEDDLDLVDGGQPWNEDLI